MMFTTSSTTTYIAALQNSSYSISTITGMDTMAGGGKMRTPMICSGDLTIGDYEIGSKKEQVCEENHEAGKTCA